MTEQKDLLGQTPEMPTQTKTATLDDLLNNPFGQPTATQEDTAASHNDALLNQLTPEQQEKAKQIAEQIKPGDSDGIMQYGTAAQAQLSQFADSMLKQVQLRDVGPIGDTLQQLMSKLQSVDPNELSQEDQGFLQRLFKRAKASINEITSKYTDLSSQVDKISFQLEQHKNTLLGDIRTLDDLYDKNKEYFTALNIYIAAAEIKRDELQNVILPQLKATAEQSDDQMKVQDVNDLMQYIDRLEKRIYDLKLSRQMSIQQAPQIRLIQNTNQALGEKIQSSILTAIPLWKNQIAIAITLLRQQNALQAQRAVTATTNDLLKRNAELLKANSVEAAKENERGIIDIETLKKTQQDILDTIEETLSIQQEGRRKRQAAEAELVRMESELKEKLLQQKQ